MWFFILIFFLISADSIQAYKAAVVHYYPLHGSTPQETISRNVDKYQKFAMKAKRKNVDILVFPEYGLVTTTALEDVRNHSLTIDNPIIQQLQLIARDNQIYLVVNFFEDSNGIFYNTNLVFDRNGLIIHKFRKIHLFNERDLTPGSLNQTLSFSTDFNVTFGLFTCFDIFFENPSQLIIRNKKIKNVIFVTGWVPSYISLSIQHGYAMANRVNFLAANYGRFDGYSGTGIFLANGKNSKLINNGTKTKMLVKTIPDNHQVQDICFEKKKFRNFKKHFTSQKYLFKTIHFKQRRTQVYLANSFLDCHFDIILDSKKNLSIIQNSDIYKVMIFEDSIRINNTGYNFKICSLLACFSENINSCGSLVNVTSKFKKISIMGNFSENFGNSFYRPITFASSLTPLKRTSFCENNLTKSIIVRRQENVNIVGIMQRTDYSLDTGNELEDSKSFKSFLPLFWGRPYFYPLLNLL